MSFEALTVVINHSVASGTAQVVLINIANHQGEQGAWPSVATLARLSKVSERRCQQIIRELVELGELAVEENEGFGSQQYKTNRYWVTLSCPVDCDGTIAHKTGVKFSASGVKFSATRGEVYGTSGVKPTSPEPKEEPEEELKTLVRNKFERGNVEGFEEFWTLYPRRQARGTALVAYAKAVKGSSTTEVLDGVRRFANDPNLPPKQYIPMPATWLNQERWTDGPMPERERTKEELEAIRADQVRRRREVDLREAAERREAARLEAERLAANPVTRCEHDRVKAICPICSPVRKG